MVSSPRRPSTAWLAPALLGLALTAAGCEREEARPMVDQPRYEYLEPSTLFDDGQSARPPIPNTISRDEWTENPAYHTGETADGLVQQVPTEITAELLDRGQTRFNIYCTPCHGQAGYGEGMIVQRGYTQPPSLHIPRLRVVPDGHFFNVITDGFGRMPSYAAQVPVEDRWAIVAYIRALQLSQRMRVDELPSPEQMGGSVEQGETSGTGGQRGEPTER
jgi:mono/diheme cytochrome c family protein